MSVALFVSWLLEKVRLKCNVLKMSQLTSAGNLKNEKWKCLLGCECGHFK